MKVVTTLCLVRALIDSTHGSGIVYLESTFYDLTISCLALWCYTVQTVCSRNYLLLIYARYSRFPSIN